ncbi:MAG: hypothetical protein AAF195_03325, partial [Pseudomonadota bacterium]
SAEFSVKNNNFTQSFLQDNFAIDSDNLFIKRILSKNGKSKCFINDEPVSNNILAVIGRQLVEIHSQNDNSLLLSNHLKILDEFSAADNLKEIVNVNYKALNDLEKQLDSQRKNHLKLLEEKEYYQHVYDELTELCPGESEEIELADKRRLLMNQDKFIKIVNNALSHLTQKNNPLANLQSASRILMRNDILANNDMEHAINALERAEIEVEEAINSVQKILQNFQLHDMNLDNIEERLFKLRDIARKYNVSVASLPEYLQDTVNKLEQINLSDVNFNNLTQEILVAKETYVKNAKLLSEDRQLSAQKFQQIILQELKLLKMDKIKFIVNFEQLSENKWSIDGMDKVDFLIQTNLSSKIDEISKVVSGGELSRVSLAVKVALHGQDNCKTIIFDEVDTGIGGAVANAMGNQLKRLSANQQIIAITHQPQVASKADYHYKLYKKSTNSRTIVNMDLLNKSQSSEEIARMLSGENITNEARLAADSLINNN